MRGVQILSVALVVFLGHSLAIPVGTPIGAPELSRSETSLSKRQPDCSGSGNSEGDGDDVGCFWGRDEDGKGGEDEPGRFWGKDEDGKGDGDEPGYFWWRDASRG